MCVFLFSTNNGRLHNLWRWKKDDDSRSFKIAAPNHVKRGTIDIFIPSFEGDCNYSEYAKWELEVEKELLSINNVSEHERIRTVTSAFIGYAFTWWQFRCENYDT